MSEHGKGKYRTGRARARLARKTMLRDPVKSTSWLDGREIATAAPAARTGIGAATGTDSPELSHLLLREALLNLNPVEGQGDAARSRRIRATMAALGGIAPRDSIEGMLAAQMVAVHEVAMDSLRLAVHRQATVEGGELNIAQAVRLMTLYGRQMDTLARHRGGRPQTVSVGHVRIEPGAQAIVGNVSQTRGDGSQASGIRDRESGVSSNLSAAIADIDSDP